MGMESIEGETVVGKKKTKEYLVKWVGYGDDERTWLPVENLEHTQSILFDWVTKHSGTSAKKSQPRPPRRKKKLATFTPIRKVNLLFHIPRVEKSSVCRGGNIDF